MKKCLIINADDFGWDKAATEGILELIRLGAVSSTTVLATHVSQEEIKELNAFNKVSTGFHINLIDGTPVSKHSQIRSITDASGQLLPAQTLYKRFLLNKINKEELQIELLNQLFKLKKMGLDISHADSHRHIHQYPILGDFILKLLRDAGIKRVRLLNTNRFSDKRRLILKAMSLYPHGQTKNFATPQLLLSDFSAEQKADMHIFSKALNNAFQKYATVEMMTHPGIQDRQGSYLKRKEEFEFLKSGQWKFFLEERKINLISFKELQ